MVGALHVYDDAEPKAAAMNMAIDEALLRDASTPILRYYRWRKPALSFGYFGYYAEVAGESGQREIVRRWTGGGIVPHGDDLTYSIIIPSSDPAFELTSVEIYRVVHEAIRTALNAHGIAADLATHAAPKISEACFANAVRADVMSAGRKIAGAAHRRSRAGLLHQGSIQHDHLPSPFRTELARILCDRYEIKNLCNGTIEHAEQIAREKYATVEWLHRR